MIGKDGKNEEHENLGADVDSGSPQTLVDFIRWSKAKAPADRYALIIWNHGSGWDPRTSTALPARQVGGRDAAELDALELADRPQPLPGRRWRPH